MVRRFGLLAVCVLLLTGCGSDTSPSAPSGAAVVREWTDSVRHGDFATADGLFALPALVANGPPVLKLAAREDVDSFNRSFPCGAEVTATKYTGGGHVVATFSLVKAGPDRPCNGSVGGVAQVDFLIQGGKIKQWIRRAYSLPPGAQEA